MQIAKTRWDDLGLKMLTTCQEKHFIPSSSTYVKTSSVLSPSTAVASFMVDDYIGTESCFDINDDVFDVSCDVKEREKSYERKPIKKVKDKVTKRETPPPIPLLARTENLTSHMPWVLKRYYTSDGRLVLKEEKVKHHEYFKAHRSNGRLTLQLVPLNAKNDDFVNNDDNDDGDDDNSFLVSSDEDDESQYDDNDNDSDNDNDGDNSDLDQVNTPKIGVDIYDDDNNEGMSKLKLRNGVDVNMVSSSCSPFPMIKNDGGRWLKNYKSMSSPCFFSMSLPSTRPIHT